MVILEGPVLVEHYVAREDAGSVAGNIYLAKVRNVLPGMEAAFLDFGAFKNGVLYASDVASDGKGNGRPNRRIENVLKEGDDVLVQVTKDAMGAKGARLTGVPSLPGRYLVLVPDSDSIGISRRLPDDDRTRLREGDQQGASRGIRRNREDRRPPCQCRGVGCRYLPAAQGLGPDRRGVEERGAPRLVHQEPDLLIKVIREHFTADFRKLLIDDAKAYETVVDYLRARLPTSFPRSSTTPTRSLSSSDTTSTIRSRRPSTGRSICRRAATWSSIGPRR